MRYWKISHPERNFRTIFVTLSFPIFDKTQNNSIDFTNSNDNVTSLVSTNKTLHPFTTARKIKQTGIIFFSKISSKPSLIPNKTKNP